MVVVDISTVPAQTAGSLLIPYPLSRIELATVEYLAKYTLYVNYYKSLASMQTRYYGAHTMIVTIAQAAAKISCLNKSAHTLCIVHCLLINKLAV